MLRLNSIEDRKNSVTIQVSDLKKVLELQTDYPKSILSKAAEIEKLDDTDELEFFSPDEVSYFMSQPWILQYLYYDNFSIYELKIAESVILDEIRKLESDIKKVDDEYLKKQLQINLEQYKYMLDMLNKNYLDKTFDSNSTVKNIKK